MSAPDQAAAAVDADELVELVRTAVGIPSITPNEADFARWVERQLNAGGWDWVERCDATEGRPNVYGTTGGDEGRALALAGHLDTVHVDDWTEHWAGTDKADPFGAHLIDGEIFGRGVADQKAGICASIAAVRAIDRCGLRPRGRLSALFVVDEESGQPDSGVSVGIRAAVDSGVVADRMRPDFLIYTEPTTSAIYTAQMGFLIADITLVGRSAYFGRPELGIDALRAGHDLLSDLWAHSQQLEASPQHELIGQPFLLVTSVNSGGNIAVPGTFQLSLIRKILPREEMAEAASAIEAVASAVAERHGVQATVAFTAPRDHAVGGTPDECPVDHPGVQTLAASIAATTGTEARIEAAPYWSEKPFLAALGVPGVYFAPGDISDCHTPFERLAVDELVSATRTLAHFIVEWCGVEEKTPTTTHREEP